MKKELKNVSNVGATFLVIRNDKRRGKLVNFFNRLFNSIQIAYPVFTGNFIVNNRDIDILHNQDVEVSKAYDIELDPNGEGSILRVVDLKTQISEYNLIRIIKMIQWCQEVDNWTYLKALRAGEELMNA